MKKHRSFKNAEKPEKKSRAGMYLAIFIAVIMVGGIGGIFLGNPDAESDYAYKDYTFRSSNNMWITEINKNDVSFYFLPQQIEYLNVSREAANEIKNSKGMIFTFDPGINETTKLQAIDVFRFEIAKTLAENGKQAASAVLKTVNNSKLPVATCDNSSFLFPIVEINYDDENIITNKDTCIVVSAVNEQGLITLMENIRYKLYGIIE